MRKWNETGQLEDPTSWNRTVHDLLLSVNVRRMGLDPWTFRKLVTEANVKIEGSGQVGRNHLVVERSPWLLDGLEAYVALIFDTHMSAEDAEFHRRNLSLLMRRLGDLTDDFASRRMSLTDEGCRTWEPNRGDGTVASRSRLAARIDVASTCL